MTRSGPLPDRTQIFEAFAAGEISRREAMDLLRMSAYSQLLNALADRGNAPSKPPPEQVEAEVAGAMPVLRMMEARHASGAGGNGGKVAACPRSNPLQAFARGLISHREAIRAGRLRDYAALLAGLGAAGLAPPRPPGCEIEAEAADLLCVRGRRAVLLIAEDAPLWSLRAAGRLDLLLRLGMAPAPDGDRGILVLDGVLDAVSHDAAIGAFIQAHSPPIAVEKTWAGEIARRRRLAGLPPKTNAGDTALADFMTADGGIDRYLRSGDPFLILSERTRALRPFGAPANLYLLSTAGLLRGLERAGVIASADRILRDMLHPPVLPPPAGSRPGGR